MDNENKQTFTAPLLTVNSFDQSDAGHTSGLSDIWSIRNITEYDE